MAMVAAIRAASVLCNAPLASTSSSAPRARSSSDSRYGPQFWPRRSARFYSSTSASTTAAFSSSCSFSSCCSLAKLVSDVRSRGRSISVHTRDGVSASPRCEAESNTDDKIPFGYTRKDVILIGLGLLGFGIGLKYGLEFLGVDSIRAGNAVQLFMVLGLTIGWISSYVFRVSSKDMTYAKQLKDYENKVMQKRLEEMPEAELESMLAQIEEEKKVLRESRDKIL